MDKEQSPKELLEKIDFFLLSAHELRTSLSAMKWLFKMLADGDYGVLNDEQRGAINQAMGANDRMVTLLNNTMLAIKDTGTITYMHLPVHLAKLVAEIAGDFSNEATEKHIAITYNQPAVPITITGDESKLRIAFHNVIENSIKYSKPETKIVITLSEEGDNALLVVQDEGAGIPADKKEHVFEKFFRAENTLEKGTGLGLYSTKLIVEHHGGTIGMESEEGKGSTVTITLPLHI